MVKSFIDISWLVDEPTYRADSALSYSTLSTYEREGFNGLEHLFDKKDTESLLFGSCVDAIITGGYEEFENRYIVIDIPDVVPSIAKVVKSCYERWGNMVNTLSKITDEKILEVINECEYQPRWRDINRIKSIRDDGNSLFKALAAANGKTVVTTSMYNDVLNAVNALKTSDATKWYFNDVQNDEFDIDAPDIEHLYQLKFKATFNGINYRCMADELIVDHKAKIVYPIDLKTSSHYEWEFYKSFVDWNYAIQARLYWRIIRQNMDNDPIFKDYKLDDYRFIVVNKKTLTPLVWIFTSTTKYGPLLYGPNKNPTVFRDPFDIGEELTHYLEDKPKVPFGIICDGDNSLTEWLNKNDL